MVLRRTVAAWGMGSLVVVGAAATALINELHGGWGWRFAAAVVVVVWAVGTGWLTYRAGRSDGVRQETGSVIADRMRGSVTTETTIEGWRRSTRVGVAGSGGEGGGGDVLGEGAVRARIIGGDVSTRTNLRESPPRPGVPPSDPGPPAVR
jgi:hypothetical protein